MNAKDENLPRSKPWKFVCALVVLAGLGSQPGCGYEQYFLLGGHFLWDHHCNCCNCDYCGCGCQHQPRCCACPPDAASRHRFGESKSDQRSDSPETEDLPESIMDAAKEIEAGTDDELDDGSNDKSDSEAGSQSDTPPEPSPIQDPADPEPSYNTEPWDLEFDDK
jgi:hypothetical protein